MEPLRNPGLFRHRSRIAPSAHAEGVTRGLHPGYASPYFLTYFCTRQFSVSATKISSRGLTAM